MGLPELLGGATLAALVLYALLGGADYGGGVWDLLARGPRASAQRDLIAHSIGPVWEANHVWLVLAVVLLFVCFPPAFARTVRAQGLDDVPVAIELFYPFEMDDDDVLTSVKSTVRYCQEVLATGALTL